MASDAESLGADRAPGTVPSDIVKDTSNNETVKAPSAETNIAKGKALDIEAGASGQLKTERKKTEGPPWAVRVLDYRSEGWSEPWQLPHLDVDTIGEPLDESVVARLYLCEGPPPTKVQQDLSQCQLRVPESFFSYHDMDSLPTAGFNHDTRGPLFVKWARPMAQSDNAWSFEKRMRSAKIGGVRGEPDPRKLGRDYTVPSHATEPYRAYYPTVLDPNPIPGERLGSFKGDAIHQKGKKAQICHGARECVSFYPARINEKLLGIVLCDPPRTYTVSQYRRIGRWKSGYTETPDPQGSRLTFDEMQSSQTRFEEVLRQRPEPNSPEGSVMEQVVKDAIVGMALHDEFEILNAVDQTTQDIRWLMESENTTRQCIADWRRFLSVWSHHISSQMSWLETFSLAELPNSSVAKANGFQRLASGLEATRKSVEAISNELVSSMSIYQSQKAISEAESVAKLTSMAFFFIPLTFSASVFGMDLVEFSSALTIPIWVVVSVGLTSATYCILFRKEIAESIGLFPSRIRRVVVYLIAFAKSLILNMSTLVGLGVFLGVPASIGIGLWKLWAGSLTRAAKIGITVLVSFVGLDIIILSVWLIPLSAYGMFKLLLDYGRQMEQHQAERMAELGARQRGLQMRRLC
ncbi:hypothetical protein B0T14DRAFT_604715 [Immersiella caudata]|uniref:Uncharacterized protein n=1 Tax=Immersiella caudata TaxID=314043 RepID=A0AA39WJB5_9PEZI|nr:hypothetical protein B0T14DRAFT_604715 [Immersiella caudata]